jgi:carboxyl-terminal processing protease
MIKKIKLTALIFGTLLLLTAESTTKSDYYSEVAKSQKLIMDVYKYTVNNYADKINLEEYTRSSIKNMVESLDPYTVYMEEDERQSIDLLTKGKYGGVGIQISKRQGALTVIAPIDDTPAQRAGIQSADVIAKIDTTITKDLSSTDAAKLIRGKKGTTVILHIKRVGYEELLEFPLVRDDIKVKDVAWSGMIDEDIGYIRLTRFSKNSAGETKEALKSLLNHNPQGIIFDLRDNPGGLLQSSIEILDMLIPKGELLLSTKGRIKKSNREFLSQKDPVLPENVKVAILINNGSASASEIVSGTVQDLDRGIVIGRKSFGKGLVQSVYGLDKKRSLKLTTAKYFIPSGRLIQKEGYVDMEIISEVNEKDSLFYTTKGRIVKGSGGITPDLEVEKPEFGPLTTSCWRKGLFFSFVQQEKNKYNNLVEVNENKELLPEFSDFIHSKELEITLSGEKLFEDTKEKLLGIDSTNVELQSAFSKIEQYFSQKEEDLIIEEAVEIRHRITLVFANHFDGVQGKFRESFKRDSDVREAMDYLSDDQAYDHIFSVENVSE